MGDGQRATGDGRWATGDGRYIHEVQIERLEEWRLVECSSLNDNKDFLCRGTSI